MDKRGDRGGDEPLTMLKGQHAPYPPRHTPHRNARDLQILVLGYLIDNGPTSITRISYITEINSKQKDRIFGDMVTKGLIVLKSPRDFLTVRGRRTHVGKLLDVYHGIKTLVLITPLGHKYFVMAQRLDGMIKWHDHHRLK